VKISVVLRTLNGANTIGQQLDAVAKQDWDGSLELVVSDNGSTDDTRAVVEAYAEHFPSLIIIDSSEMLGCAHASNAGASAATGDYLLFIDDDDQVGNGWLGAMARALEHHPFVAARLEHRRLNPPWTRDVYGEPQTSELLAPPSFLPFGFGGSLGVRRDVHDRVGGFDDTLATFGEDADYCYRIQLSGTPLYFARDAVVHYRDRTNPHDIFQQYRRFGRSWTILFKRYAPHGMQRPSQLRALASWCLLVAGLPLYLTTRKRRAVWLSRFGWKVGRLEGSVHERVLAL
jgi:GT2 family glycosyltransferase